MNHIHKLQEQRTDLAIDKMAALNAARELQAYLLSDKFRTDTTVQVQDVLNRLQPVISQLLPGPADRAALGLRIDTSHYVNVHGREPGGFGTWFFNADGATYETVGEYVEVAREVLAVAKREGRSGTVVVVEA